MPKSEQGKSARSIKRLPTDRYWMAGWFLLALSTLAFVLFSLEADLSMLFKEYGHFFGLGLFGAIVANSTGAGGGIIFIPFFSSMGLSPEQALGTSIIIQCFGMTSGSLAWLYALQQAETHSGTQKKFLTKTLIIGGLSAIAGILATQYLAPHAPIPMAQIFRIFSVLFGGILIWMTLFGKHHSHTRYTLHHIELSLISIICFLGGVVTAWISIGVGEWLALFLIFRRFPTMLAIACGVCLSSITVFAGAPFQILANNPVWPIILFAAPAALIGGVIARLLATSLGPARLKIFFATWVLATGIVAW